ncbi:hypothetical protein DSO57_1028121 [Entomophthora muscae]|uniref:Uncharacterized protein n=1 Tax=Entomophthora muscae TaxID=34485 RepID=A0ACC2RGF6_9FUNG|nr:hypothetical protein DSO57_1028121 [Entomophthora muscae]
MSKAETPILIKADTAYAKQYELLVQLKSQIEEARVEHKANLDKAKLATNIKKYSVLKNMCEVFKTIPDFWAVALRNSRMFTDTDDDDVYDFMKYIADFEVCYNTESNTGGKIIITLKPNPYMKNTLLCREVYVGSEADRTRCLRVKYVPIEWKAGKELFAGPLKVKADFSPGSFVCWLQDRNVLAADLFLINDFFPSSLEFGTFCFFNLLFSFYRGIVSESDEFTDNDRLYHSNEEVSLSEDDSEDECDVVSEDEQPASKKARKN